MNIATAARRRIEARAVGRTPEQHAALERALARRRVQLQYNSPVSRPVQQHHLPQVEDVDPRRLRSQFLGPDDLQGRVGDREGSPPAAMPEYLHEVDDSEIYTVFKMYGLDTPRTNSTLLPNFDYASG
ncbi:hypothetical protein RRF57_011850 [Xylaria bambusicola]|uniref:Uncharacterized protein n=1 Tax=Xylaria bambusicola TaxID=326684 RepID=A0AAN7UYQ9_9PEZI